MQATRIVRGPLIERLFSRLQPMPNGCIEYMGKRLTGPGYGIISQGPKDARKEFRVHRVVFELNHGPIPDDMQVCHTCDNPPCCNPDHLFLGTRLDNMRDMRRKNRSRNGKKTHCVNGHEFTAENTLPRAGINGRPGRRCRTCVRESSRRKRALNKQAA